MMLSTVQVMYVDVDAGRCGLITSCDITVVFVADLLKVLVLGNAVVAMDTGSTTTQSKKCLQMKPRPSGHTHWSGVPNTAVFPAISFRFTY